MLAPVADTPGLDGDDAVRHGEACIAWNRSRR